MIKYVAFYNLPEYKGEGRTTNLAGISVMDYMKDVYAESDNVDIYSPSHTGLKSGVFPAKKIKLTDRVEFYMPKSRGAKTFIGRVLRNLYTELWLLNKLIFKTKKTDTVICYHSPYVMKTVEIAKKIKKFKLILEIREIYGDVYASNKLSIKEKKFFTLADKYIFATEDLKDIVNKEEKPYLLAPGSYKLKKDFGDKFEDGKYHLVYAGNMSVDYGGAYNAVRLIEKLGEKFILHVLSSGSKEENAAFLIFVEKKGLTEKIIFEGTKYGEDFDRFLQKCDLGLSTRYIDKKFNETSFPSKVLTYLTNGVKVLSPRLSCVERSPVGDMVEFYDEENWEQVASSLEKNAECSTGEGVRWFIKNLDAKLKEEFKTFLTMEN